MIQRENYLKTLRDLRDINVIKIITGARRIGKSTLLEQFREDLLSSGVSAKNIISYNLEEIESRHYQDNPKLLYDEIIGLADKTTRNYVFLDEIQILPNFEQIVDSLFTKKYIDLYLTGSNAYMTSSEIATLLSGRYVEIEMAPLSFKEFVQFFPETSDTNALFEKYLKFGGFPEVANMLSVGVEGQVPLYLQNIYRTILEKDIELSKKIQNMDEFRSVSDYIFDNIGNITSVNKIANILNKNAITVEKYLKILKDCFLLFEAKRFDIRGKELLKTLQKYYAVDLGLVNVVLPKASSSDIGHKLENIAYLELRRRYRDVWIGRNQDKEIDFVVRDDDGVTEYYQVAMTVADEETLSREISAFPDLRDNYRKTILTLDTIDTNEAGIEKKNIIKWLLS